MDKLHLAVLLSAANELYKYGKMISFTKIHERMNNMATFYVDNAYKRYEKNPFDNDKPYDESWILLKLIEEADDFQMMTTGGKNQVFRFIITKKAKCWQFRVMDFIQYEMAYGKNIILAVNENDLTLSQSEYGEHTYNDCFLRDYEEKVLVHTTTKENYCKIISSGTLKSWNILKNENRDWEEHPIGAIIGDPANYSNYIMFGTGGYYQEIIPLSKQKGHIEMDVDCIYTAGARLYFSAEHIAKDGLLIRDGAHLKVKDRLSISDYLLWTATPEAIGISEQTTPRIFAETSDRIFTEKFNIPLEDTCY